VRGRRGARVGEPGGLRGELRRHGVRIEFASAASPGGYAYVPGPALKPGPDVVSGRPVLEGEPGGVHQGAADNSSHVAGTEVPAVEGGVVGDDAGQSRKEPGPAARIVTDLSRVVGVVERIGGDQAFVGTGKVGASRNASLPGVHHGAPGHLGRVQILTGVEPEAAVAPDP
jgi:hypothetical protein